MNGTRDKYFNSAKLVYLQLYYNTSRQPQRKSYKVQAKSITSEEWRKPPQNWEKIPENYFLTQGAILLIRNKDKANFFFFTKNFMNCFSFLFFLNNVCPTGMRVHALKKTFLLLFQRSIYSPPNITVALLVATEKKKLEGNGYLIVWLSSLVL